MDPWLPIEDPLTGLIDEWNFIIVIQGVDVKIVDPDQLASIGYVYIIFPFCFYPLLHTSAFGRL